MGSKIVWKFTAAFISLILLSVLILNFFVGIQLKDEYEQRITRNLLSNASLAGDILKDLIKSGSSGLVQQKTDALAEKLDARITVIDSAGRVIGESEKKPLPMDDHSNRPEIKKAVETGEGESMRFSDTLSINMKYVAVAVKEGGDLTGIIRLALPMIDVESRVRVIYKVVLTGGLVAIVFVLIAGFFISRNMINPISGMTEVAQSIAAGDFSKRAEVGRDDELGIMARSLNSMADELELKMINLEKMDDMRAEFVANVSHELKTPLTSIKGFVETLEGGAIDDRENAMRFLSIIGKHAEGLSNITDDLLKLSELESGENRIEKSSFNLKDLINEVVNHYDHLIEEKNFKLTLDFSGSDFNVRADRQKIEQVLINILDNSMKYTGEGGSINIYVYEKPDHFLAEVQDNGIGIPEEHLDRIFERFYRVDKARSRKLGGTGLGLSIVKHAVMLHGGTVNIQSREARGTKVTITLPKS